MYYWIENQFGERVSSATLERSVAMKWLHAITNEQRAMTFELVDDSTGNPYPQECTE